ncbi:MAG TPA: signal peptidase I [Pyrinomonadaceae bacterium]|nr:signal peptidase I [Pyrinomonadaceae bacterium]
MNKDYSTRGAVAEPPAETEKGAERVRAERDAAGRNGREASENQPETTRKGPPKSIWREYFESAVVTVIMALFGMTFIVQAVKVPTGSMQNTILIGDHLLVNKFIFAPGPVLPFLPQREIRRGDIIVFKYPGNPNNRSGDNRPDNQPFKTNYVKRVIGLPGDRIEVRGEHVYINGQLLDERRLTADDPGHNAKLDELDDPAPSGSGPYTVYYDTITRKGGEDPSSFSGFNYAVNGQPFIIAADSYFVMGDNRNNSADSREWGVVKREYVIGRAMFVYWSYDESAPVGDGIMDKIGAFFTNTRWSRTGTMVK